MDNGENRITIIPLNIEGNNGIYLIITTLLDPIYKIYDNEEVSKCNDDNMNENGDGSGSHKNSEE